MSKTQHHRATFPAQREETQKTKKTQIHLKSAPSLEIPVETIRGIAKPTGD
jgi:hypothetical protein